MNGLERITGPLGIGQDGQSGISADMFAGPGSMADMGLGVRVAALKHGNLRGLDLALANVAADNVDKILANWK